MRARPHRPHLAVAALLTLWVCLSQPAAAGVEQVDIAYRGWLEATGLAALLEVDEISEHPAVVVSAPAGEPSSRPAPTPRRWVLHLRSGLDADSWSEFSRAASERLGGPLATKLLTRFSDLLAVPASQVRLDLALDCAWQSYLADPSGEARLDWTSPCAGPPTSSELPWRQIVAGLGEGRATDYHVVDVFYATDRARTGSPDGPRLYGVGRGAPALGHCTVSIPRDHRVGLLETPSIWRFEVRGDPEKHVVLLSVAEQPRERFVASLRETIGRSEAKAALVFIPGRGVTFAEAARRTAQLAYDLQLDGAPILFSWPARDAGEDDPAEETTVRWSAPHLADLLGLVAAESGADAVHLVAHGLGTLALADAVGRLAAAAAPWRFAQIVLLAPDIDATIFERDVAPDLVRTARRVTLYATASDEGLIDSERAHGARRAGQAGERIVVLPGVDTIDVSRLDTSLERHSHFGEHRSVISDLFYLLRGRERPESRFGLQRVASGDRIYWRFDSDRP